MDERRVQQCALSCLGFVSRLRKLGSVLLGLITSARGIVMADINSLGSIVGLP